MHVIGKFSLLLAIYSISVCAYDITQKPRLVEWVVSLSIPEYRFIEISKTCIQISGMLIAFLGVATFYYQKKVSESYENAMKEARQNPNSKVTHLKDAYYLCTGSMIIGSAISLLEFMFCLGEGLIALFSLDNLHLANSVDSMIKGVLVLLLMWGLFYYMEQVFTQVRVSLLGTE